jgi:GMP synthase (glutamine-hydrolysing)
VNVLAVVHGANCPSGTFGEVVEERGHRLETWAIGAGDAPPRPIEDYGAVMLFGGSMHADQEADHPWLRDEDAFIRRLLASRVPLLGVCLGAQLVAKAAGAPVDALPEPEIGWFEVETTGEAVDDPVFGQLPAGFRAFEWHSYGFDPPAGARELARSRACCQAFRLGEAAWAVQFHPEVTPAIVARWVEEASEPMPGGAEGFLAEAARELQEWTRFGRSLCGAFVTAAERAAVPARG